MNCVIVDNNPHSRMEMVELLSNLNGVRTAGQYQTSDELLNIIHKQKVDLVFINIELPDTSEILRKLSRKCPVVILINANQKQSFDDIEFDVADCIIKPVTPSSLSSAIQRARNLISFQASLSQTESLQFVFVRENGVLRKVMLDEIDYVEAMGDYVKIFTRSRFYIAHTKIRSIQEKLPRNQFLKVHRSFVVALNKIDKIEEGVIIINQKQIPVADGYRAVLNSRLHIL